MDTRVRRILGLCGLLAAALMLPVSASAAERDPQTILASEAFAKAQTHMAAEHDRTVEDIVTITEIPAPPFKEAARAAAYLEMLKAHGLADTVQDDEGNVMGLRRGAGPAGGPVVVVSAHLDTVFPEDVDVTVRRQGTMLMAPGVGDDSRSLAVLLAFIRALDAAGIRTERDLLFVGTVGEEGQGDLRGVRHLFTQGAYKDRIESFFSFDGADPARIVNGAVGSKRYRATFHGPGGHSYGAFGIVNPMAAMARATARLYEIDPPARPRTTYSASVTGGGVSVNSIPAEVFTEYDMRSESPAALADLEAKLLSIFQTAVAEENAARSPRQGEVRVEAKLIGDRPAGGTPQDSPFITGVAGAIAALGFQPSFSASSTDANIPMSLGIPAATLGSGGRAGRAHALDEWIDVEPVESVRGMSAGLLAILTAAGVATP